MPVCEFCGNGEFVGYFGDMDGLSHKVCFWQNAACTMAFFCGLLEGWSTLFNAAYKMGHTTGHRAGYEIGFDDGYKEGAFGV